MQRLMLSFALVSPITAPKQQQAFRPVFLDSFSFCATIAAPA
jgi:hypothetical protein